MSMTRNYPELINDLRMFPDRPLMARAAKAIDELLTMHELDQGEIVRLRRQIEALEMKEEERIEDLREGNRAPYREETAAERRARYKRREFTPGEEEDLMTTLMLSEV